MSQEERILVFKYIKTICYGEPLLLSLTNYARRAPDLFTSGHFYREHETNPLLCKVNFTALKYAIV